jgi:hypothetical protein
VDRRELKVAYLPELEPTNRTALAGAGKGTPMLRIVEQRDDAKGEVRSALDELAREGARQMLAEALEVEVGAYIERHRHERRADGRALVVRNGRAQERRVTVGSGTLTIRAPRVDDQRVVDGARQKFTSEILPPYLRRSKRSARCYRCCTCAASRPATSGRGWRRSSEKTRRVSRPARSRGS